MIRIAKALELLFFCYPQLNSHKIIFKFNQQALCKILLDKSEPPQKLEVGIYSIHLMILRCISMLSLAIAVVIFASIMKAASTLNEISCGEHFEN